ncbi:MAG: hypothetical protein U1A06_08255 [Hoeflea sp.]|nr:hypothetical protein [Hoeflea sp.]
MKRLLPDLQKMSTGGSALHPMISVLHPITAFGLFSEANGGQGAPSEYFSC